MVSKVYIAYLMIGETLLQYVKTIMGFISDHLVLMDQD